MNKCTRFKNGLSKCKSFIRKHFWIILIDAVAFAIVLSSILIERNLANCFKDLSPIDVNIIVSLLPAIVTVISISLQLHDDYIYGTKIRDYQKLRRRHFNILHMVIITICIFIMELAIQILHFYISSIVLSGISALYAIIFSFSELPLLMKSEAAAKRVLKSFFYSKNMKNQDENNIFDSAIKNLIVKLGIKEVYLIFKNKKMGEKDLLEFLLMRQKDFISQYLERSDFFNNNNNNNVLDVFATLNACYRDLDDLLDFNDDMFNYSLFDNGGKNTFYLTYLTLATHRLSSVSKNNSEQSTLKRILLHFHWRKDSDSVSSLFANYLCAMASHTIVSGNTWFLKAYRDFDYGPFFIDPKKNTMDYILLMIMCFTFNSSIVSQDTKLVISSFIEEPTEGLNSTRESWKKMFGKSLDNHHKEIELLEAIDSIINIVVSIEDGRCDIYPSGLQVFNYDDSTHFSVDLTIDYWLQILIYHPYYIFDSEEVSNWLNHLSDKTAEIIVRVLDNRYKLTTSSVEELEKRATPFFNFIFDFERKSVNKYFFNSLLAFVNKYNTKKYDTAHKPLDEEILEKLKAVENSQVSECLKYFSFNHTLKIEKTDFYSQTIRLEGEQEDFEPLLKAYLSKLKYNIIKIIQEKIIAKAHPTTFSGSNYNSLDIDNLVKFAPRYKSEHEWRLMFSANNEQRLKLGEIRIENNELLPQGAFAQDGALSVNIKFMGGESNPRFANDAEINSIIENEYVATNGLYTFSKYKGAANGNFFVTREELFNIIRDRIIIVPIVMGIKVEIESSKIMYFKETKE